MKKILISKAVGLGTTMGLLALSAASPVIYVVANGVNILGYCLAGMTAEKITQKAFSLCERG